MLWDGVEPRPENQTDDLRVTGGAGLDTVRLPVLVVHAPAGVPDARAAVARDAIRDRAQVRPRSWSEPLRHALPPAARQHRGRLAVNGQPAAVLPRRVAVHAGEPAHEVRLPLVVIAG